jgi:mono/diheme cytochrome c family protein
MIRFNTQIFAVFFLCLLTIACKKSNVKQAESEVVDTSERLVSIENPVDYGRDIQPILSNYCYQCHGPDTASREAGLRLDLKESALGFKNDQGVYTIVPGNPDESELVKRVESHDPELRMPQDESKLLNPEQIKLLRTWIAEGAEFRDHWAYEAPVKAPLPEVNQPGWTNNAIDHFVLAKLDEENLKPNQEADRGLLIRRATLDTIGLLPTPEEVDAFVADESENAYEKVIDRLLESKSYGEHRAHFWLDYSRYGDSAGLHADGHQNRWPYRDYVIRSFNEDKPFDQFTMEQLAGDLMPLKNIDQLVATGFIRNGINTGEGGTFLEELRVNLARERLEAFGAIFSGMSTTCAACHDHKYDPLSQEDTYQLSAFFNNINEKPSNDENSNWPPFLSIPKPESMEEYNKVLAEKSALLEKIKTRESKLEYLIDQWLDSGGKPESVSADKLVLHLKLDESTSEKLGSNIIKNSAIHTEVKEFKSTGPSPIWGEDTLLWRGFRLASNTQFNLGELAGFERDQAFSVSSWIKPRGTAARLGDVKKGVLIGKMSQESPHRGWNVYWEKGAILFQLSHDSSNNLLSVEAPGRLAPVNQWTNVCVTYDGSGKAAGVKIYINGKPVKTKITKDTLTASTKTEAPLWLARRHPAGEILQQTGYQEMRIYQRELNSEEVSGLQYEVHAAQILAEKSSADWTSDDSLIVSRFYFREIDTEMQSMQQQLTEMDKQLAVLSNKGVKTLVTEEADTVPYADVLDRGGYASRLNRVQPDTPHFLPPMPDGAPKNRLGLAQWVTMSENPLTARVTVNRMWQEVFGYGLVETSEEFGIVGDRASHPALLDYLAVDFMGNGWKIKRMYKMMLMSATYRQSAKASQFASAEDPKNRLLSHGPRFRMPAESLRDAALQSSGLLVNKIGGPSVKPYQPDGLWATSSAKNGKKYVRGKGEDLYRRSLYTYLKRTAPIPNMTVFDATDRTGFCARRQRSNTPMAALTLMNDPQFLEAARLLGNRAIKDGGSSTADRIQFIAKVLLARTLEQEQISFLVNTHAKLLAKYSQDEVAANDLLKVGDAPIDKTIPPSEQAVWMLITSSIMNTDAAITK